MVSATHPQRLHKEDVENAKIRQPHKHSMLTKIVMKIFAILIAFLVMKVAAREQFIEFFNSRGFW